VRYKEVTIEKTNAFYYIGLLFEKDYALHYEKVTFRKKTNALRFLKITFWKKTNASRCIEITFSK
jgi:hypothetical protein